VRTLTLFLAAVPALLFSHPAHAVSVTVCVDWTLEYNDDDSSIDDDHFNDKTGPWTAAALGSQVRITRKYDSFVIRQFTLDDAWTPAAGTVDFTAPKRDYFNIVAVATLAMQRHAGRAGSACSGPSDRASCSAPSPSWPTCPAPRPAGR
jgi:hypothetical protein